jgi:ribosomal RNA-processing protein 9
MHTLQPPKLPIIPSPSRTPLSLTAPLPLLPFPITAKEYLNQVKLLEEANRGDDGDDEYGADLDNDVIAARLKSEALQGLGHLHRRLAHRLSLPLPSSSSCSSLPLIPTQGTRLLKGHRLTVTAIALTADDHTVYSVAKDGCILAHDVATGIKTKFSDAAGVTGGLNNKHSHSTSYGAGTGGADWVAPKDRQASHNALLAVAVSDDGRYLATGGGDKKLHIYDARSHTFIRSFPGHKDAITGLAFRPGTRELYSCSLDRSVKLWSLDDMAYVDTLFGHQAEVLGVDAAPGGRAERALTCGADRTCRLWKIPEESQLIYRASCLTVESCAFLNGGGSEWVTGAADGSLQLWTATKKKAGFTFREAHSKGNSGGSITTNVTVDVDTATIAPTATIPTECWGAGGVESDVSAWVSAVTVCKGSDLIASGAGDGVIRLWGLGEGRAAGLSSLEPLGGIAARGFVNGLKMARSGRFVVAGMGKEPRMGRWEKDGAAKNGVLVVDLEYNEEEDDDGDEE